MPVLSFQSITVTVPDVKGFKRHLPIACQGEQSRREVLHNVSGSFPKKGLVAIMGPSGSGKTTFLNAVSNRMSIGGSSGVKCSGIVRVDGQVVPPDYFYSKNVSFVPQDTCLFSELTPRESIRFSTSLVFPHLTDAEIDERTNNTIAALNLQKCADTQVGNEMFRGVSGGERKRTAIGVSIVNEPSVLFLDEPTTGLDSETASMVVRSIQGLSVAAKRNAISKSAQDDDSGSPSETANANASLVSDINSSICSDRIIIMTLHQPSSDIWDMIDHLVLLVQGYIVYNGPASESMDFFVSIGFKRPLNTNPADFFLDIMQCEEGDDEHFNIQPIAGVLKNENTDPTIVGAPKTTDKKQRAKFLAGAWRHRETQLLKMGNDGDGETTTISNNYNTNDDNPTDVSPSTSKRERLREIMLKYNEKRNNTIELVDENDDGIKYDYGGNGFINGDVTEYIEEFDPNYVGWVRFKHQLKILTKRSWMTFTRTKLMIPLKLLQVFITAVLIICLFSSFGDDQVSVLDRSGCMYLVIIVQIFATVLSVVMLFPEERGVYLNEQASRLYAVLPYFTSKLIIDIPILVLTIFFFSLIVYFPVGFQSEFGKFICFFLVVLTVAINGHGLGLIVASIVASPSMAALLAPMAIAPLILFSHIAIPGDPNEKILWILRPLQIFSPFWWGLDALMVTEFVGLKLSCTDSQVYAVPSIEYGLLYLCRFVVGEEVLMSYSIEEGIYPLSLFMLFLLATINVVGSAGLLKFLSMRVASHVPMDPPKPYKESIVPL